MKFGINKKKSCFFAILLFLVGCGSHQVKTNQGFLDSIRDRYGLGIIYQDYNHQKNPYRHSEIDGGLVIRRIAPDSEAFKSGVKSGWILVSVEDTSLNSDGQNILFNRVQNKSLPNAINVKAYDGNKFIDLTLHRVKGGYPLQSFLVVN